MEGEDKLKPMVRDLEKSIERAISRSPQVEECLSRVRDAGYEISLVLQATLVFAPTGQLDETAVEALAGISREKGASFRISPLDRKFLRSLKIAVDATEDDKARS